MNGDAFRERVRVRLAVMGLSQAELCREHGVAPQELSNWLARAPNITVPTLCRIASMLAVRAGWLLDGDLQQAAMSADMVPKVV